MIQPTIRKAWLRIVCFSLLTVLIVGCISNHSIDKENDQTIASAVFVSDSRANEVTREAVIAEVAQVVWNEWSN
jgi:hypothetical protein